MKGKRKIGQGIYLVIDPSQDESVLMDKLTLILQEKIVAVQLWDNFPAQRDPLKLIQNITERCHEKCVPVLINNQWEWLRATALDGVHFDRIPHNFQYIKQTINREFVSGLTCNNDLSLVQWANENGFDYISFCSVFPSTTSNSCELVKFETIQKAKSLTSMPVFLAGGIKPENVPELAALPFDGIAVISGIMNSDKPDLAIQKYSKQLKANKT
ncbi:thiamine phosphate synthase [Fulvivirgaceae bacterium BMA12]|uniref:Thiamine phosphate synthase n=1 Tax=Agaribacillus aureus TaxID=3051825 RepID=A0ABT8LBP5_9BACT|nr:thiamine phosphate synthase [Fulvivirgaceae bacterium BMA12]